MSHCDWHDSWKSARKNMSSTHIINDDALAFFYVAGTPDLHNDGTPMRDDRNVPVARKSQLRLSCRRNSTSRRSLLSSASLKGSHERKRADARSFSHRECSYDQVATVCRLAQFIVFNWEYGWSDEDYLWYADPSRNYLKIFLICWHLDIH